MEWWVILIAICYVVLGFIYYTIGFNIGWWGECYYFQAAFFVIPFWTFLLVIDCIAIIIRNIRKIKLPKESR